MFNGERQWSSENNHAQQTKIEQEEKKEEEEKEERKVRNAFGEIEKGVRGLERNIQART